MTDNDEAFDAMANHQRRQLLDRLLDEGPQPVPYLSSVSREILQAHTDVLREYLAGPEEVTNANKADIRTHHVHLPKLAEYDYVDWDRDAHVVTKGGDFDDVRPLLELADDQRNDYPAIKTSLSIQK